MVEYRELKAKKVLNRHKYRDNWFWCRYSVNPYRGCQFACNYCDAITEKYLVHKDWEDFSRIIYVKANAPELLERELKTAERDVISLGGVTDAYQPAEKKYRITRRILEIMRDHCFPVHIVTKSDLILRDADILSEISRNSWCTVSVTIITQDKNLVPFLEPFAPPPEKRFGVVRRLSGLGIRSGVDFTPIIPYICDNEENMRDVIGQASESEAQYILPGSMTLRSNQKIRFLGLLKENWPHLMEKYERLYGDSQSPNGQYVVNMNRKLFALSKEYEIPLHITPPNFDKPLRENFDIANLLLLYAYFKEMRTGNTYAAWAYHKAAQNIEKLDQSIRHLHKKNELKTIPGVGESISGMIREFLETGKSERLEQMKLEW